MSDFVNVKVNRNWHTLLADEFGNNPCKYVKSDELFGLFGIPESVDVWRECDDGHDDELLTPTENEDGILALWDGDRLYTAAKQINGG